MQSFLRLPALILVLTATCLAQFVPCKTSQSSIVGHSNGITEQTVTFLEPSREQRARVFIPDSESAVPGIVFSHSAIQSTNRSADLAHFAEALARAGAAAIVLGGTIEWNVPNDKSKRDPHLMACAGQWLLLNAHLDRKRLAVAGAEGDWGGGNTPFCQAEESPCWHAQLWLNFGETGPAELRNSESMLTTQGQLRMARFAQRNLRLNEVSPEWLDGAVGESNTIE
jgi:hypothetical protein